MHPPQTPSPWCLRRLPPKINFDWRHRPSMLSAVSNIRRSCSEPRETCPKYRDFSFLSSSATSTLAASTYTYKLQYIYHNHLLTDSYNSRLRKNLEKRTHYLFKKVKSSMGQSLLMRLWSPTVWVSFQKIVTPNANCVNLWHTNFLGVLKGAETARPQTQGRCVT